MSRLLVLIMACFLATKGVCAADPVFVVGHRNPDADSVAAAVAVAHLFKQWKGFETVASVQRRMSREAAYALEKFGFQTPTLLTDAKDKQIVLVDHSDKEQAPDNIFQGTLLGIFDHHKLGGMTTINPPEVWIRPLGSTCTVVKGLYDVARLTVPRDIAGLMLCAILSDTLTFRSPTTTPEDRSAAEQLAQIAGVADVAALGAELLTAKESIITRSSKEILFEDFKDFSMSGRTVGIGQIELADSKKLSQRLPELFEQCKSMLSENDRHTVMLVITDITRSGSLLVAASKDPSFVEKAFGIKFTQGTAWVDGLISRKQQVVPALEKTFSGI